MSVTRTGYSGIPVNLRVEGRRVVVVGGGRIAARKLEPLLDLGASVLVVAPSVTDEIHAWVTSGRCQWAEREFRPTDLDGAWLALTATDDPAVNEAVYAAGEVARVWVNSADDPANCSFTMMSLVRRADLVIAIGTGGRSPALAAYLRRRFTEEIGVEYEVVLELLSEAREALRSTGRSSEDADWQRAFDSGIVDLVRAGRVADAKELLELVSLIVVGLNHRTAPVDLLERMTVPDEQLTKVLHDLSAREHLLEVVVLSTCNRTEVYARCTHFHPAVGDVSAFLADYSGASPDDFADLLYTYYDEAAVGHLFSVAAGLDSMIVGESEILGQVREAWQTAVREGTAPQLAGLFRHAVESGKRVRTETGIGRHPVSIPSAAVAVASEHLGSFDNAKVLVVGAGQMASGLASTLRSRGVAQVWIANRTFSRAEEAAERVGGVAIPFTDIADTLVEADVLLSSTASPHVLIERSTVEMVMACRAGRPLLVVDVALPRDVDPGVREINDVTLLDLDDLKDYARRSAELRRREIGKVREILAAEIERYRSDRSAREVAPLVTSLRDLGESVRTGELARFRAKLEQLGPDERAVVEALTQGIVNKLLHEPTVRVKNAAGTPRGEYYADALAALFDLPSVED